MTLTVDSVIGGYPVKRLRTFLRAVRQSSGGDNVLTRLTLEGVADAHDVALDVLIEQGLFAPISENIFQFTQKGVKIAILVLQKRMNRTQIEALLADVLIKFDEVNNQDRFVNTIGMLGVFGSYLRDEPDYGDLDIVYRLELKPRWQNDRQPNRTKRITQFHLEHFPADKHVWYMASHPGLHSRPLRYVKARRARIHLVWEEEFVDLARETGPIPCRILRGKWQHDILSDHTAQSAKVAFDE